MENNITAKGQISNDFILNLIKNIFSKTNDKNYQIGLGNLCDRLNIYLKKYTIFLDGIGSFCEDKLKDLLLNNGYQLKDKCYLKLKANYFTLEESKKFLGEYATDSTSETQYKNYSSLDLIAYHESNNSSLGNGKYRFDHKVTAPYILYTDETIDYRLNDIKKFKLNNFSVIHYEDYREEIWIISFYVKTSKRKKGYGAKLLLEFFYFMQQKFPNKAIRIHNTTEEITNLLKKLLEQKLLEYSSKKSLENFGNIYELIKK